MTTPAANLQRAIQSSPEATARVLAYLDRLGVAHSGQISGATLAAVCGAGSRRWREWVGGEREMPESARRLLEEIAGIDRERRTDNGSTDGAMV